MRSFTLRDLSCSNPLHFLPSHIANVGDSTCIAGGTNSTKRLCFDHTPARADERERITKTGGVVMTVEERDGNITPSLYLSEPADLLRVWSPHNGKFPGCGFTRSLGDSIAHTLGVTSCPEIFDFTVGADDRVLIVATDGVTECKCFPLNAE
jgi:serine/threonine protein phosphatase PrpC